MDKFLQFVIQVIQILRPDINKWIVRTFIISGIALLSKRIWDPYLQSILHKYYQINVPNTEPTGWALITIGVIIYFVNIYVKHLTKPKEVIPFKPVLVLEFSQEDPFVYTEPAGATGLALRGYRVKVTNNGAEDISNCIVYLDKMISLSEPEFKNAFVPIALITQKQRQQNRRGGEFNLRAGQHKYIEVAWLDEGAENSQIVLQYEDPTTANMVQRGHYILSLIAYGGGSPVCADYQLYVDDGGYLRFENYSGKQSNMSVLIEETIVVDFKWPVATGYQKQMEEKGYNLRWSRPDKVASRCSEGYEVMFNIDQYLKKKQRIELKDGSVLIGKKA